MQKGKQQVARDTVELLGLAAVYYLAGRLGTLAAIPPGVATAFWPPSGIVLAILLIRGPHLWPGIVVGSFLLNYQILTESPGASFSSAFFSASFIAVSSSLQTVLTVKLLGKFGAYPNVFDGAQKVFRFVAVSLLSCFVAATLGALGLAAVGFAPWGAFAETWVTWWLGDAIGILTITPLILVFHDRKLRLVIGKRQLVDAAVLAIFTLMFGQLVFGVPFNYSSSHLPMAYLFLPLIVWASFRLGFPGGILEIFITSIFAIWGTIKGTSQFSYPAATNYALLAVQLFVGIASVTGMTLGAVLRDRKRDADAREKHLAQEIALRRELARSNEDLERFAQIASHDLQEPLRMVSSYLSLLEQSLASSLKENEKEYLHYAIDGAKRMKRLIQGLLEFSSHGLKPTEFRVVNCETVIQDVLQNLKVTIEETGAQIEVQRLPRVLGDNIQLNQVFQNLLGNALKYCEHRPPQIKISAEQSEREWMFTIRDNGIGLDMKYADRIFQVFQRLHAKQEYPGAGLGLSVCKRIIERHGGKIWVESEPGVGSTFTFTLPVLDPKPRKVCVDAPVPTRSLRHAPVAM